MPKQELYSWISLAATLALIGLYIILAIGLPESIEDYSDAMKSLFLKVIGFAILIRAALALFQRTEKGRVEKDERDALIELKGYRSAYYLVVSVIVTLVLHLLVSDYLTDTTGVPVFLSRPYMTLHVLVITFLVASVFEYATRLFYYRKDGLS